MTNYEALLQSYHYQSNSMGASVRMRKSYGREKKRAREARNRNGAINSWTYEVSKVSTTHEVSSDDVVSNTSLCRARNVQ